MFSHNTLFTNVTAYHKKSNKPMISISKPQREDAEQIHDVIKKSWYATYVNEEIGITKEDIDRIYEDDPEAQIQALRNRAINPKDDDISFSAKEGGKVLGYIRLKLLKDSVDLMTLYVHPDHSGKGVGEKLWTKAMEELPKDKPVIVEVATYTKAVDFYKKMGFVDTGERYTKEVMMASGTPMPLMKMIFIL
jgi:ribosomal protein S18 acetylase RimI-like enzyme